MSVKVALVGDGSAGKSSLCARLARDAFSSVYAQTRGFDTYEMRLAFPDREPVRAGLWDVGGQTVASVLLPQCLAGADAVVLVVDVTNRASFANLEDWLRQVRAPWVGVWANKTDALAQRQVSQAELEAFVAAHRLRGLWSVSAKTGDSVLLALMSAVSEALGRPVTAQDREFWTRTVRAHVARDDDERRTAHSEAIEREDAEAEARREAARRRQRDGSSGCCRVA